MSDNKTVEIFYACDDAFIKYTVVSLVSIMENASKEYKYNVHVLYTHVSEDEKSSLLALQNDSFKIEFNDVSEYLASVSNLPLRDYYSKTTYFRLFIADMFKDIDKAIYIDSDTVVNGDISELYKTDLGEFLVGACHEQAMIQTNVFGDYCEAVLGNSRHEYFNAGVLLLNCRLFREKNMLSRFISLLSEYDFVVTQDQDYLNVLCKDKVLWLDQRWNTEVYGEIPYPISEAGIIHYIMTNKPWKYRDTRHSDIFWSYADKTSVREKIICELESYTDEMRERDRVSQEALVELATREINREDNYLNRLNKSRSADRVRVLEKIDALEREGIFDKDVEDDPPTLPLTPDNVNYLNRGIVASAKRRFAFFLARRFFKKAIKNREIFIDEIVGAENIGKCENAIITCNHFNAFDSFVMQYVFDASGHYGRMFRVIREGNYTSFPGFYGFLMRNCNTLPLSSNKETLHMFLKAADTALSTGNCVLVYPEQSMWYNYRKPKPHKSGGFDIAVRNNVPIVPCFITMKDSDVIGEDGYPVQIYKPFVGEPIYPDESLPRGKRSLDLMNKNYEYCKKIYESFYGIPLIYSCDENGSPA